MNAVNHGVNVNITCIGHLACESAEIIVKGSKYSSNVYIECGGGPNSGQHACRASTINITAKTASITVFGNDRVAETLKDAMVDAQNVRSRFV